MKQGSVVEIHGRKSDYNNKKNLIEAENFVEI